MEMLTCHQPQPQTTLLLQTMLDLKLNLQIVSPHDSHSSRCNSHSCIAQHQTSSNALHCGVWSLLARASQKLAGCWTE